jgi:CheY-specific phosphatase CheX
MLKYYLYTKTCGIAVQGGGERRGEKMFSISKQDALKIVQAMRMLQLLDEQFFNDIDGAERLMKDLTLLLERKIKNEMLC